ncbi:uncharacterized protein LOC108859298 isoform X2 [Raphanus sativus]|uniref:Uncharacterized protein LOC108859298 isoform X2 n=1 Tax=Raphanus sativus TaxID=3726 RepID=A0A9W3BTS1_RAPSA|nr:uncharacterized protein LOC108859298 isoform X2 [Raphanus sativus]
MCLHVSSRIQDARDGSEKRAEAESLRYLQRVYDQVSLFLSQIFPFKYAVFRPSVSFGILDYCNEYRITKLEELDNAANNFLLRFQQGLCLLKRSPIVTSSKLIENILKNNETKRLKSYIEAGCINIDDAAQSTRALHISLKGLSDHLIKAQSLLSELERLTDEAALAIETATNLSTQLDEESSDELQREKETVTFAQEPEVTEYATVIAVVYSMVKQNYVMQEKIVRGLSLKTSFDELGTYTMMWSLRPFVEDEIVNRAWKCIY